MESGLVVLLVLGWMLRQPVALAMEPQYGQSNPYAAQTHHSGALPSVTPNNDKVANAHANRLMRYLFEHYNKALRPVYNDSQPVSVMMHLWFKQVLKVDEIDQILTIYCWTEQHWVDQFLAWDPLMFGGISVLNVPAERIWKPDILVYNNADMNVNENELSTNVVLNHTGGILYFRAVISKVTCNLDMTYFPFDKQDCNMMFASWSYDGGKVIIRPRDANNSLEYYIENTEWKLDDFRYGTNIKYYDCCLDPFPDVTYHFRLERNPSYYILNLIIPSVFIVVVTMVGFFTPYSSTGENTEKVSLGVTALLSLAIILLMVADKMPATSKVIPLIGKYYIGLIWLIFAATIITTITLRLQSKGNAGRPLPPEIKRIFFGYIARLLLMTVDLPADQQSPDYDHDQRCVCPAAVAAGKHDKHVNSNSAAAGGEHLNPARHALRDFSSETVRHRSQLQQQQQQQQQRPQQQVTLPPPPPQPACAHLVDLPPPMCTSVTALLVELCDIGAPSHSHAADKSGGECSSSGVQFDQSTHHPHCRHMRTTDHYLTAIARQLSASMGELESRCGSIVRQCVAAEQLSDIQNEWGQLARVVERILMLLFVCGTVLFVTVVTYSVAPDQIIERLTIIT